MLNGVLWIYDGMRSVLGLDPETGETRYKATPEMTPDEDYLGIQLIAGKAELYGVSYYGDGAFAVDPTNGDVIWEMSQSLQTGWRIGAGAVAGDLLVAHSGGKLFGIS